MEKEAYYIIKIDVFLGWDGNSTYLIYLKPRSQWFAFKM